LCVQGSRFGTHHWGPRANPDPDPNPNPNPNPNPTTAGFKVGHPPLGPKSYSQAEYVELAKAQLREVVGLFGDEGPLEVRLPSILMILTHLSLATFNMWTKDRASFLLCKGVLYSCIPLTSFSCRVSHYFILLS
jgi:hypothetical protein